MIATCTSCGHRSNMPADLSSPRGAVLRCGRCGHSWIEPNRPQIVDVSPLKVSDASDARQVVPVADATSENQNRALEREAQRIAEARRRADLERRAARTARNSRIRRWTALAAAISIPVLAAIVFPETVVRYAPGSYKLYRAAGMDVNIRGFAIRNVRQQYLVADGKRVLALRGEVVNLQKSPSKVPAIRFTLRNGTSTPVYAWTLDGVATRALKPREVTTFLTRIASPPETADNVEIRFARAEDVRLDLKP